MKLEMAVYVCHVIFVFVYVGFTITCTISMKLEMTVYAYTRHVSDPVRSVSYALTYALHIIKYIYACMHMYIRLSPH